MCVLVTGASSGIGAAIARGFCEHGADVAVHYRQNRPAAERLAQQLRDSGSNSVAVQADLRDRTAAQRLVGRAVHHLGGIDVLVNNAGAIVGRPPFPEVTPDTYREILDANLGSALWVTQSAHRTLVERAGSVINVGSVAARTGGGQGAHVYAASKAAVASLTRVLAKDFAGDGIRVNAISPGVILTPLHERHTSERANGAFDRCGAVRSCGDRPRNARARHCTWAPTNCRAMSPVRCSRSTGGW